MELSYRAANRAQNTLWSKYNAGTLTKEQYIKGMENLSDTKGGIRYKTEGRFIGQTGTPERIITAAGKDAGFSKKQIQNILKTAQTAKGPGKLKALSALVTMLGAGAVYDLGFNPTEVKAAEAQAGEEV